MGVETLKVAHVLGASRFTDFVTFIDHRLQSITKQDGVPSQNSNVHDLVDHLWFKVSWILGLQDVFKNAFVVLFLGVQRCSLQQVREKDIAQGDVTAIDLKHSILEQALAVFGSCERRLEDAVKEPAGVRDVFLQLVLLAD
jgi:hypothetical protein